ncbi:hypothetical protein RJT34_14073 [Clitoria ternatea]|uniref:Transmembrane protein n=1 Tax=Clitoria ternatea TaxID=43366 RepID=A0AAN9PM29_CLITE
MGRKGNLIIIILIFNIYYKNITLIVIVNINHLGFHLQGSPLALCGINFLDSQFDHKNQTLSQSLLQIQNC